MDGRYFDLLDECLFSSFSLFNQIPFDNADFHGYLEWFRWANALDQLEQFSKYSSNLLGIDISEYYIESFSDERLVGMEEDRIRYDELEKQDKIKDPFQVMYIMRESNSKFIELSKCRENHCRFVSFRWISILSNSITRFFLTSIREYDRIVSCA